MNTVRLAGTVVLVGLVTLAGGCAAPASVDELRSMIEQAQSTADSAQATAQQATSAAAEADRKATEALRAANDASNCCAVNSEKIDRMFEKVMQK